MKVKIIFLLLALNSVGINLWSQLPCGTKTTEHDDAIYLQLVSGFAQNGPLKIAQAPRYIPIQCHIIRQSDGTGGISVNDVDAAIEIVNMRYAPIEFHFFRCSEPNYIDNDDNFAGVIQGTTEITDLVNNNVAANVVNIFFGPSIIDDDSTSTLCGFARFPWTTGNYLFMDNGCTMNGSTLSHELGHYFGLYHTHHSSMTIPVEHVTRTAADACYNCTTGGDLLCDTEADPTLSDSLVNAMTCAYTGGANETCNDAMPAQVLAYNPDATNLMSYSRKDCRDFFSAGQYARLVDFYNTVRMAQLDPTICSNSPCYDGDIVLPMGGSSSVTVAKTARAEHSITSTEDIDVNTAPGVTYKAGGFVCLTPGFSTADGTIFVAFIEECFAGLKPEPPVAESRSFNPQPSEASANMASMALSVVPNPSSGEFTVAFQLDSSSPVTIRLFDGTGRLGALVLPNSMMEKGSHLVKFDAESLPEGFYFLVLETADKVLKEKLVISR